MAIEIKMPALSPTMEEGTLAKWLVADGDDVRSGDVIAEIETDKATMEVEAIEDGKIGQILVPAGTQHVKVNAVIAMLLEDGESASAMQLPTATAPAAPRLLPIMVQHPLKQPHSAKAPQIAPASESVAEPVAQALAEPGWSGSSTSPNRSRVTS